MICINNINVKSNKYLNKYFKSIYIAFEMVVNIN